jgi:ABC-2 type transport system permease protein
VSPYVRAEWSKLWTVPGTAWLLLAAVVGTAGLGALSAAACSPAECAGGDPTRTSLTGLHIGQCVVAILAVLAVGGEYATGMMRVTLAALPHRPAVLAAKAGVLAAVVLPSAAVAVPASLLSGDGPSLADGAVLRAAVGSVLYLLLVALLALGVATVVRNPAAAIGCVLGLLYLFPIVAMSMADEDWQRRLQRIGPMSAGQSIQATTGLDHLPIGPWAGLGVVALWAAGALLLAAVVLQARDA